MGRGVIWQQNTFIVPSSCSLYPIMVIQSYYIRRQNKTQQYLNIVLNQDVIMSKRTKLTIVAVATLAISIVDSLCLLQQYKWNTIKMRLPRLIINATKFCDHSGRCRGVNLAVGHTLQWPLPLQRGLNKSQRMDCPPMNKKKFGRCRELAVVERWPQVDVPLYSNRPIKFLHF